MALLPLLVSLLLATFVIRIAGAATSSLQVDDLPSALTAAAIMTVLGWILETPFGLVETVIANGVFGSGTSQAAIWRFGMYFHYIFNFLWTCSLLWIAAVVTPNVRVRGVWGLLLAAAALSVGDLLMPTLLNQLG